MVNARLTMNVGLIKGRHPLPVPIYIWDNPQMTMDIPKLETHALGFIQDMAWDEDIGGTEELRLYVTGFTPALTSFLNMWSRYGYMLGPKLVLMHWDNEVEDYIPQPWGL